MKAFLFQVMLMQGLCHSKDETGRRLPIYRNVIYIEDQVVHCNLSLKALHIPGSGHLLGTNGMARCGASDTFRTKG